MSKDDSYEQVLLLEMSQSMLTGMLFVVWNICVIAAQLFMLCSSGAGGREESGRVPCPANASIWGWRTRCANQEATDPHPGEALHPACRPARHSQTGEVQAAGKSARPNSGRTTILVNGMMECQGKSNNSQTSFCLTLNYFILKSTNISCALCLCWHGEWFAGQVHFHPHCRQWIVCWTSWF